MFGGIPVVQSQAALTSSCCDIKSKQCVSATHMLRAVAATSLSLSLILRKLSAPNREEHNQRKINTYILALVILALHLTLLAAMLVN